MRYKAACSQIKREAEGAKTVVAGRRSAVRFWAVRCSWCAEARSRGTPKELLGTQQPRGCELRLGSESSCAR